MALKKFLLLVVLIVLGSPIFVFAAHSNGFQYKSTKKDIILGAIDGVDSILGFKIFDAQNSDEAVWFYASDDGTYLSTGIGTVYYVRVAMGDPYKGTLYRILFTTSDVSSIVWGPENININKTGDSKQKPVPSCSNGIKDGDETGTDTGGSCGGGPSITTPPEPTGGPLTIGFNGSGIPIVGIDKSRCPSGSTTYTSGILKDVPCDGALKTLDEALLVVRNVIQIFLLPIVGTLFTIMLLAGGIMYITSRGNQQQLDRAKKTLTAAIIGLLIVILSYTLIVIFAGAIGGAVV